MISLLVGLGLFAGLMVLAAPVSSLVAGFFLDEIAAHVEREVDPAGPLGKPAPALDAALFALRFAGLSIVVNVVALVLLFVPGVGIFAWIGRERLSPRARIFRARGDALPLRRRGARDARRNAIAVFAYGVLIAGFVAVPLLNLLTPLFATTLMARLHKRLS